MRKTERFNEFIASIDQLIDDLRVFAAREAEYKDIVWNFSEESLFHLDNFLIDAASGKLQVSFEQIVIPAIAYYGDVFIRVVGGKWKLSKASNQSKGRPVLDEYAKPGWLQDPYGIVMSIQTGRTKVLTTALESAKQTVDLYRKENRNH